MQIDTIPKLTAQILAIENQRQNWSNLKNEILHHRVNLEKKLGVLPEHDDTLRDAVHSCNSMIAEYDRLEESAVRYIGALGRDRDRRSEILRSKQWFDQAWDFYRNFALVRLKDKIYKMDKNGELSIETLFEK
jgi:hypothetical protein